jgi:hypothetical protein
LPGERVALAHGLVVAVTSCQTLEDILTGQADALDAAAEVRADEDAAAEKEFDEEVSARRARGAEDESELLAECDLSSSEVWAPLVAALGPTFAPRDEGEEAVDEEGEEKDQEEEEDGVGGGGRAAGRGREAGARRRQGQGGYRRMEEETEDNTRICAYTYVSYVYTL